VKDIQVLASMNRGGLGSNTLNIALQKKLNGHAEPKITRFGSTYAPGDKVIQMSNNYDKAVFNGDISFIEKIDLEEGIVTIRFDNKLKEYEPHESMQHDLSPVLPSVPFFENIHRHFVQDKECHR